MKELIELVRGTLAATFVVPVREGRPRPSTWPRGLPAIGAGALLVYILLVLVAVFAVPLRQNGTLLVENNSSTTLPASVVWLLMAAVVLSFSLVHTAALHTSWPLRILLFVIGSMALFFFAAPAFVVSPPAGLVSALLYLGLFVFTVVRARRQFVWWEFVVVTVIVSVTLLMPGALAGQISDMRLTSIDGTFATLGILTYPALLVAGAAPAQIVVTGAEAAARRPLSVWLFALFGGGGAVWLIVSAVLDLRNGSDDLNLQALAASLITLALVVGALALWLRRGHRQRPEPLSEYPDYWQNWLYPLAAVIAGLAFIAIPVQFALQITQYAGLAGIANTLGVAWNAFSDTNPGVLWRAGIGVVLLVIAWRLSRRGRTIEATLLSVLALTALLVAAGLLPGLSFLHEYNTRMIGLVAAVIALAIAAGLAARRQLTRSRAVWIVTVILLAALYPFRNILSDPASAALFFSAPLLVLFGLTWRLISDAEWLGGDTRALPRPTRVLLFIANTLFAATAVAFVALSRATGSAADTSVWVDMGDWTLGEPLYTAGLAVALWLAIRPENAGNGIGEEVPVSLTDNDT
ncbi:MAG: hypothetical protein FWF36_03445 [Propionibacteriaceae bacterium]|nr:hypothetical protein [Propionibacteriaceae bacterium]